MAADLDAWIDALAARHQAQFSRPEFLKAVRALSARYVERRAVLHDRSPLDSAGKRAAFASFYTPLHLLTTGAIVQALQPAAVDHIVDLGCGTGAASAGWALAQEQRPADILGIDRNGWALSEARWNWDYLGLKGRVTRGDLIDEIRSLAPGERREGRRRRQPQVDPKSRGLVFGWSVNELNDDDRKVLLRALLEAGKSGGTTLIIEPLAQAAVPWWKDWTQRWLDAGGRCDEWKIPATLPHALADVDRDAGFRRGHLAARSLFLSPCI